MHPRQARLITAAENIAEKTAAKGKSGAPTLFKYVDEETGKDFYLPERKTTVKSPWSGKAISVKPEKYTMGDVGKELKSDAKAEKSKKAAFYLIAASTDDVENEIGAVFDDIKDDSTFRCQSVKEGPQEGTSVIRVLDKTKTPPSMDYVVDNEAVVENLKGLPNKPSSAAVTKALLKSNPAKSKKAALIALLRGEG